jgi:hypothetical protein
VANSTNERAESGRDTALVNRWSVLDPHRHDHPFIQTPRCVYRRKLYVVRVHTCLEEAVRHVD